MQNVDSLRVNETNEVGQDHSSSSSPISTERGQSLTSIQTNFMADMSESDEDDVSEVESFILDQGDLDEEPVLDTAKFLLQGEESDSPDLHNVDPETQARLEALLEATGIGKLSLSDGKQFADPEVLRRLTSSVSCALDEAAAALTRMRAEHGTTGVQGESGNGGRSLAEACSDGDVGTVRKLLDEGRNVNEITEEGESLLSLACSSGYYELAQLLLAMRANVEDRGLKDTTPLMEAANAGHGDIVKLLVGQGADTNAQTSQGNTPLMFACAGGHEEVVQALLEAGANVEDHNENGHTPLMEAASGGHVGVAKLLVEHGASINTHSNEFKESALTLACYKGRLAPHPDSASTESAGHLEMVRFLLEAGADQEHKTDEMHTALMEASMDGHVEVARLLLDSGAQVNMPADSFESPLTLAACGGHVELAMLLLERGANIEEVNDEGYTPLMEAAREGHEEMVALLLSQGADINAQTEETQETALTLACCGGFLEVADFLIKAGADIELGASTPLMEAAQEGHLELVRFLINSGATVNAQTATKDTALTYACENGHTDVADILLQANAELEHESEGGRTPLMKAARAGHLCTVQFLISKGAQVNKQTSNNDHNPLSLACAGGHLAVVELLLAHGADPSHKLKDNSTMLIEAAKGGHTAVVQLLLDYPNNILSSPPPPPDLSQLTTSALEATEAPRVPPHGLQVFSPQEAEISASAGSPYLATVQPVPRLPQPVSLTDISHSQQTTIKQNIQKSLQRKAAFVKSNEAPSSSASEVQGQRHHRSKSNAAAQANSTSIQAETAVISEIEAGGGGIESVELKPSERLEACINSMMKKAELLNPSREEQILQKQQILEELQRVERELQEKAQAQLLLTAQHQQHHHHHHLQGLATVATVTPTIATVTNNTAALPTITAAHSQQLLLNSATILDMGSLPPTVVPELSGVTGHLGLSLRATTAAHLTTPPNVSPLQPQQLYQPPKALPSQVSTTEPSKNRISKQPTKQNKNVISKQQQQQQQQQQQIQQATHLQSQQIGNKTSQAHLEEVEKMNLRNVVLSEQQQQFLQHPQQFVLSELTQNLTLRANSHLSEGTTDALTLMQAAGGIKFTAENPQAHAIPIIDPVAVSQAFALQQQQQQQLHFQQIPQTLQTEAKRQHTEKVSKTQKVKLSKSQQSQQLAVQHSQCNSQLIQNQPSQTFPKSQLNSTGAVDSCTLVGNLPIDATGMFTLGSMATPTFPVSLAVSPATLTAPVTIATSCAAFTHSIALEDGLMVAAPARTLHDTLGEIMTGPTTQLAGTPQMAVAQQVTTTHCVDPCLGAATSGVGVGVGLTMTSPSSSLPLTFHTLAPAVTSCVPAAVTNAVVPPHHHPQLNHTTTIPQSTSAPQTLFPPLDLNSQTDSNHDTALTLACAGGHEELVSLLLSRGADIEHRDKKGFTPLMLAATAGHAGVVEILLNHGADIEAQSERTKDTALSLACSGGRYEVVEILLARGANKEHRNVSDYTPLSLAASGGYVNIIKLLLSHGAEINSRTGSKLGISPLMLAAMNGHTAAVKLLLDMGSDINAQIETNRNTALTLACFQGRHEVVSLLLDRKANVEHRAKTGLTPLMEAASGGYVEVGRVLLDKGADVNAPPVPSSRDTALTIAADKGHYRFVELLLSRNAAVDVKNKKGNSPLWLAANGGHLDVVQLLVNERADIDSQDNRKVSCLMAAFRKGHVKVVKWMVKHVTQFPSDQEMTRYIATINDKELLKKCHQCMEIIRAAKERQAAEANKYATILLEELDLERSREETRRAAAARRRERKRRKKKEKQEQLRAAKAAAEESKKNETKAHDQKKNAQQSSQSEAEDDDDDDDEEEDDEDDKDIEETLLNSSNTTCFDIGSCREHESPEHNETLKCRNTNNENLLNEVCSVKNRNIYLKHESSREDIQIKSRLNLEVKAERKRERDRTKNQERNKRNETCKSGIRECRILKEKDIKVHDKSSQRLDPNVNSLNNGINSRNSKKRNLKHDIPSTIVTTISTLTTTTVSVAKPSCTEMTSVISAVITSDSKSPTNCNVLKEQLKHSKEVIVNGIIGSSSVGDIDDYCSLSPIPARCSKSGKINLNDSKFSGLEALGDLALELSPEVALSAGLRSPTTISLPHSLKSPLANSTSPKKGQKREEGWKEVVRRSKKVSVPSNAISRVIGRGGCNINAIREVSGAHIEVEKQKGQGDRTIIIRGSAEATRQAHQLITSLIKEPERELSEILTRAGLCRVPIGLGSGTVEGTRAAAGSSCSSTAVTSTVQVTNGLPVTTVNQNKIPSRQTSVTKISGIVSVNLSKVSTIPPSLPANAAPPFASQPRTAINSSSIRPSISVGTPFPTNSQNVWTGVVLTGKAPLTVAPRSSTLAGNNTITLLSTSNINNSNINEKTLVSRQLFPSEKKVTNVQTGTTTTTKTTVSYTMAVIAQGRTTKTVPANAVTVTTKITLASDVKISSGNGTVQSDWSGGTSSTTATSTVVSSGQGTIPTPSPFPNNPSNNRLINGPTGNQSLQEAGNNEVLGMNQKQPFIVTSTSHQNAPSMSPTSNSSNTDLLQSTIAQEYSPFNNLFSKVAQPSVWGQKDREMAKPNFASVAAAGVTSVSSHVQNSHPIQSSLSLSLSNSTIVDAAKAPGYRGNLHISPNASCNPTVSTLAHTISHNSGFGAIGSGPRSAPCTPPLGPIGPPSSTGGGNARRSTPPSVPSPPPLHSRSLPDSHGFPVTEVPRVVSSSGQATSSHSASHNMSVSQMSEGLFQHHPHHHHHAMQNISGLTGAVRLPTFPLPSGNGSGGFSGPGGSHTNTTFSQHSPLSSVGPIIQETGSNNGNISNSNSNLQVLQSNLNPNAPDFSSRASLLVAHHGPSMHPIPHRLPSGPNTFQEGPAPSLAQFRPILPSAANMNHTFPSLHGMPAAHPPGMGRFPFHPGHNQQQQPPPGDFNNQPPSGPVGSLPPGMGGPTLQQANEGMPLLGMMGGYPPHPAQGLSHVGPGGGNISHHYPTVPSMMGIRPNQRSSSTTPSVGASSKVDEGSPMSTMSPSASPQGSNLSSPTGMNVPGGEDRKLPRPIGMERAQRKHPVYSGVSDLSAIWSYNSTDMSCPGEWMTNLSNSMVHSSPLPPQEDLMPPLLPNNYGNNRFGDNILVSDSNHPLDHSFQLASAAASGSGYPHFVNGLPPHVLTPHLYQNNSNNGPASLRPAGLDSNLEMWGGPNKMPLSSVGDGLPSAPDHKMAWHNWSQHRA